MSAAMRTLLAVAVLAACGPSGRNSGDDMPEADAGPDVDAAPPVDNSRVFAHSDAVLYRLDNRSFAATQVGSMTGLDNDLLDLAIDKDDKIVGVTRDALWSLNAQTGAATMIRALTGDAQGLTSLSYVPDPNPGNPDILVSANRSGQVFRIDPATGTASLLGSYGTAPGGAVIGSSGDLFGVRGFGIFATVDVENETLDYLAKIDPVTWKATIIGPTGYDRIFGLGYWDGRIYGFVDDGFEAGTGKLISIDATTGDGTELSNAVIRWFGAGVATDAPLL